MAVSGWLYILSMRTVFIPLLACLPLLWACKDDNNNPAPEPPAGDQSTPYIRLYQPVNLDSVPGGDTLRVLGQITDNDLHEVQVRLSKSADGTILFNDLPVVHGYKVYDINRSFPNPGGLGNCLLLIRASDHSGNIGQLSYTLFL